MKPAIIFLCQRTPCPPIKGDRIATYNYIRYLARRNRVFLGTFFDDPNDAASIPELRRMVETLHIEEIRKPWAFLRAAPRWLFGDPISFALFRSARLRSWMDEVMRRERPTAIVAYSSNIATYAIDRLTGYEGVPPRRVLIYGDVDSEKFAQYAERARGPFKWILRLEAKRVRREESRLARQADVVALVTPEEASLFEAVHGAGCANVEVLPNGVDTDVFDPGRYPLPPFSHRGPVFIFTGAMDYPPNVQAVVWFSRTVFPALRARFSDAAFLIVGVRPSPEVRRLAADVEGVEVVGRVESTAAYLAHASVVVAPLQIARGLQNKVLEGMAMARPVVASRSALTGISAEAGRHLACAETPKEWVDECARLVSDSAAAAAMGREARRLVLDTYNWDAQFARLERMLHVER
jgi:sugar transferase (PEP-CTERM/EpsH1 system associated)